MKRLRTIEMVSAFKRVKQVSLLKQRLSRKDFDMLHSAIWRIGPRIRYTNPDCWR